MNSSPAKTHSWLIFTQHYVLTEFSEDYIKYKEQIYGCGFTGLGRYSFKFSLFMRRFIVAVSKPGYVPSHPTGTND